MCSTKKRKRSELLRGSYSRRREKRLRIFFHFKGLPEMNKYVFAISKGKEGEVADSGCVSLGNREGTLFIYY